jgi:hypothetical protein
MRPSLIVLAIVLATLRVVQAVLAHRAGRALAVAASRRRRFTDVGVRELSLPDGPTRRPDTPESGRKSPDGATGRGDRRNDRFAEWRYYGFNGRGTEAEASDREAPEVVASSPAVGSIVTILPDGCVTTVVNGHVYRQCGSVWYQRQDTGSKVTYVVVPAP